MNRTALFRRFSPCSVALRLFITCWLIYVAHFATNIVREIYPAITLGEHLSFDVREYVGLHPDIFGMPGRGAFINNNPGVSILGAVPYALARPIVDMVVRRVQQTRVAASAEMRAYDTPYPNRQTFYRRAYERGLDVKFGLAALVMQGLFMAPLSALSVVVMFGVLRRLGISVPASVALALLYAFATPVFYRTSYLNHNLVIGHFAFFAFVLLWRPGLGTAPRGLHYLLAGLLCGWTIFMDYTGALVILVIGAYAVVRWFLSAHEMRGRYRLPLFGAGVAVGLVMLLAYQWQSFGHPFYPAQRYMPATTYSHDGFFGFSWPKLDLLAKTAFGSQFGLFSFAPILLLALYVPGWLNPRIRIIGALEVCCIVSLTLAFLIFSSANQYGYMQFNTGVRYMVPTVPFLFLLAAGVMLRIPAGLAAFCGPVTTYWSWALTMYREVGDGSSIYHAIARITLEGPRLPWLTTLGLMGYVDDRMLVAPLLVLLSAIVVAVWLAPLPTRGGPRYSTISAAAPSMEQPSGAYTAGSPDASR